MIYTLTLNPAVDYVMTFKSLNEGEVNRSLEEQFVVGGKGINVSTVLNELGHSSVILGFIAGFTGKFIEEHLKNQGMNTDFCQLENGNTRINIKVKADKETDLNGAGPAVTENDIKNLLLKLNNLKNDDILVLSGSAPLRVSSHIYEEILCKIQNTGVSAVVDATGDLLINALKYRPFLVKPNERELSEIFGVCIKTVKDAEKHARQLHEMGALNVLVSRGSKGALLLDENGKIHNVNGIPGKALNTVGAGDSMVAGFISGYLKTGKYEQALTLANACAAATAFSNFLAKKSEIDKILNNQPFGR